MIPCVISYSMIKCHYHDHFFSTIKFIHHFENYNKEKNSYKTLSFQRKKLIRLVKFWGYLCKPPSPPPQKKFLFGPVKISYHTPTESCLRKRVQKIRRYTGFLSNIRLRQNVDNFPIFLLYSSSQVS